VTLRSFGLGASLLAAVALSGCLYHFRGGNFPEHIRTLSIDPIVNDTPRLELTGELQEQILKDVPRSLGVKVASAGDADAVVRVRITSYQVTTPNYRPGVADRADVLQRQVTITAQVQIVDQVNSEVYWENTSLRGDGQFLEQGESEDVGRTAAIQRLVQAIVDGAQSNW
jgi:hypothetical protein